MTNKADYLTIIILTKTNSSDQSHLRKVCGFLSLKIESFLLFWKIGQLKNRPISMSRDRFCRMITVCRWNRLVFVFICHQLDTVWRLASSALLLELCWLHLSFRITCKLTFLAYKLFTAKPIILLILCGTALSSGAIHYLLVVGFPDYWYLQLPLENAFFT